MAQSIPTFIPEEIPPATAFTQSGESLRVSYVIRKQAKYIGEILIERQENPGAPTIDIENYSEETWVDLRSVWRKEAEIKYPDQGDYVVQIVDPETGLPVPLGEMVTFVGGDIREVIGSQPCIEYTWDLSLVDPSVDFLTITYRDCFNNVQTLTKTLAAWGLSYTFCSINPDIVITGGFIVTGDICYLTPAQQCIEYFLDLTGVPAKEKVDINFIDCDGVPTYITGAAGEIQTSFCANINTVTASAGIIEVVQVCVGGVPVGPIQ